MKAVVVTGAERGLGKTIIETLVREGYHLIAVSLSMKNLETMKEELIKTSGIPREGIDLIQFDFKHTEDIGNLADSIKKCLKPPIFLWGYVNNAAIFYPSSKESSTLLEITYHDIMEILNINQISAFLLSREMFRIMKDAKKGGSIVYISSSVDKRGSIISPVYAMSKAALVNLAKSISNEGATEKIRANCISPGLMETQMGLEIWSTKEKLHERVERSLTKRACTTAEVAYLVKYLLSEYSECILGENLDISAGMMLK